MLQMFLNPYMLVTMTTLLTAILVAVYTKYSDPEDKTPAIKSFFQVLVAGLVMGISFVFVINRPESMMTEAFEINGVPDF